MNKLVKLSIFLFALLILFAFLAKTNTYADSTGSHSNLFIDFYDNNNNTNWEVIFRPVYTGRNASGDLRSHELYPNIYVWSDGVQWTAGYWDHHLNGIATGVSLWEVHWSTSCIDPQTDLSARSCSKTPVGFNCDWTIDQKVSYKVGGRGDGLGKVRYNGNTGAEFTGTTCPADCVPRSCSGRCGVIADGCGGTRNCGGAGSDYCGSGSSTCDRFERYCNNSGYIKTRLKNEDAFSFCAGKNGCCTNDSQCGKNQVCKTNNICADAYNVEGRIYIDKNGNNKINKPEDGGADAVYRLGGAKVAVAGSDPEKSDKSNTKGYYTIKKVLPGDKNIRLDGSTLKNGFSVNTTFGNPRSVTINNRDVTVNFLLNPPGISPTTYSISGGPYIDTNPLGSRQSEPYTAKTEAERIIITGPAGYSSTINSWGTSGFSVSGLAQGEYSVTYDRIRNSYSLSSPSTATVNVEVGSNCGPDLASGIGVCDGSNNISGIDFGITAAGTNPWYHGVGGDIRSDSSVTNRIPAGAYFSERSATMDPGVVIGGGTMDLGGSGTQAQKANDLSWLVVNSKFVPARPKTIKTSYDWTQGNIKKGGLTQNPLFGTAGTEPCGSGGPACTFPAQSDARFGSGVYTAEAGLTITGAGAYTFTTGRNYVFLISGDLRIQRNIDVPPGSTVMFAVRGNIRVASNVTRIEGIYSTDGDFVAEGTSTPPDTQLFIEGGVVANANLSNGSSGRFINQRNLEGGNSTTPSVVFTFRPDFILNAPQLVRFSNLIFKEVAPRGTQVGAGTPTPTDIPPPTEAPEPTLPPAFQESAGRVVMEAENHDINRSDVHSGVEYRWADFTNQDNYSGSSAKRAQPNNGESALIGSDGIPSNSPVMIYFIDFDNSEEIQYPRTFYIWLRGTGVDANDNSVHTGLNEAVQTYSQNLRIYHREEGGAIWGWYSEQSAGQGGARARITVDKGGRHYFYVWMREDGAVVDKIVLEEDRNWSPGTFSGQGPAESTKQ